MNWLNSQFKSSLLALLGSSASTHTLREDRIDEIRRLMLDELGECGDEHFQKVVRRIRYAIDAESLWFLRIEVMSVLGEIYGETVAHQKIEKISEQFKGLLPKSLISRPSSLKF